MSESVRDLIGQIIHPQPGAGTPAAPRGGGIPTESVGELIGRIISGPASAGRTAPTAPAGGPVAEAARVTPPLPPAM